MEKMKPWKVPYYIWPPAGPRTKLPRRVWLRKKARRRMQRESRRKNR